MAANLTPVLPVPLDQLTVPEQLDGRVGSNRAPAGGSKLIAADTDLVAINAWLAEFDHSPQTQRSYRKEAERLLLWALSVRGKPLSSLMREDMQAYEVFLSDPQPRERWCGPRAPRYSEGWRPFEKPLSPASQRQALIIINALFSYLVSAGYLKGNPLALMRRRRSAPVSEAKSIERFLEQDLWHAVLEHIERLPRKTARQLAQYERLRYLFRLLYLLGPRVSEIASHTMSSFIQSRGRWWWKVLGKGQREERVPVNDDMLQALYRYRQFHDLPALPQPDEQTPLLLSVTGRNAISANMIYRLVKEVVKAAAAQLEADEPHRAAKLRQASTHWFRHTFVTHQADAGVELRHLNKSARHRKLETTAIYLHADEADWHRSMEQHKVQRPAQAVAATGEIPLPELEKNNDSNV